MASHMQLRKWVHPMLARLGLGSSLKRRAKAMTRRHGVSFRHLSLEALETRVTPDSVRNAPLGPGHTRRMA